MEKSENNKNQESFSDKKVWDKVAMTYADLFERSTLQANIVLYTQTRSTSAKKIVEVGAGAGIASRAFTLLYMQPGAVYYNSDISPGMINIFEANFKASELGKSDTVKLEVLETADAHAVEDFDPTSDCKRVFVTIANNEKLPYPDASFDRYISNLSLMLVDNHLNQISEAYRVLESGGTAGFSVVGREENVLHHSVPREAFKAIGINHQKPLKNPSHLSNPEKLKADLENAGFNNIKLFFTYSNASLTKEEHYDFFCRFGPFTGKLKELSEDQVLEYQTAYYKIFEEMFGSEAPNIISFEVLVAICKKP